MRINSLNLRLSIAYIGLFAGIGIHLPFFPLWLAAQGFASAERAAILAVPMFIRVFALALLIEWGLATGSVRRAILLYGLIAALITACLALPFNLVLLALVSMAASLSWMPVLPLLDAMAMGEMRAGRADYGRARLWGSIAFMVAAFAGGVLVDALGIALVVPLLVVILGGLGASALLLPQDAHPAVKQSARAALAAVLATSRPVRRLFVAGALLQASHAVFYVQGSVHWKNLGYSGTFIGALWMVAVLAEVLLFLWSRRVVGRFEPQSLLMLAGIGAFVRWFVMAFDPPWPVLTFLQALHALSFAATHIATTWLIGRLFNGAIAARAQGLYASLLGAANGAAMLAAGPLYQQFAGKAEFAMAALAALALSCVFLDRKDGRKSEHMV